MNNPIALLTEEHSQIEKACDIVERISKLIGKKDEEYEVAARQLLSFFRQYGDVYHHHKEERFLFPEMNKKNELMEDGIIKEMFENHESFRELLAGIELLLDKKDFIRSHQQFHIYCESLLDHIAVENDEVFQVAESLFNPGEMENIYFKFLDCDSELGSDKKLKLVQEIEILDKSIE